MKPIARCIRLALAVVAIGVPQGAMRADPAPGRDTAHEQPLSGALHNALSALQGDPQAPGLAVAVIARGTLRTAATGVAAPTGRAMTPDTPLRIASVTKTFTAAAALRLWETGRLDIDAPLKGLIAPDHAAILRQGGYDTGAITPRHLLMQSSGLSDHVEDTTYLQAVLARPGRVWTRTEQIALMLAETQPVAPVGAQFHYSDTGYVLLGEIVERAAALPLGAAVADLTGWHSLGLTTLRWEGTPPQSGPAQAHQWMHGLDTTVIHGSADAHGGGGIIASVTETARLYAALFSGAMFRDPRTLDMMLAAPGHPPDSPYRMGLFADMIAGAAVFRHAGFWGIEALAVPSHDLVIVAATLDQPRARDLRILVDALAREALARSD